MHIAGFQPALLCEPGHSCPGAAPRRVNGVHGPAHRGINPPADTTKPGRTGLQRLPEPASRYMPRTQRRGCRRQVAVWVVMLHHYLQLCRRDLCCGGVSTACTVRRTGDQSPGRYNKARSNRAAAAASRRNSGDVQRLLHRQAQRHADHDGVVAGDQEEAVQQRTMTEGPAITAPQCCAPSDRRSPHRSRRPPAHADPPRRAPAHRRAAVPRRAAARPTFARRPR